MNSAPSVRRFLVATPNVIINEDLREALETFADASVDVCYPLSEIRRDAYELAVLGVPIEEVMTDPRARALRKSGTHIVVLNSRVDPTTLEGTGLHFLDQPFSTEEVERLLTYIGIAGAKKP